MLAGDCHDSSGTIGRCVAGAINNYTSQLTTYFSNSQQCMIPDHLLFNCFFDLKGSYLLRIHRTIFVPFFFLFILLLPDNLTEALLFLAHFVGDIHQVLNTFID